MNTKLKQQVMEDLAKCLALHCFRNSHLENLHSKPEGFTDDEMKTLMIDVVNNTYSFLTLYFSDDEKVRTNFADYLITFFPKEWDKPKLDPALVRMVKNWDKTKRVFKT